jgi:cytochrome c5
MSGNHTGPISTPNQLFWVSVAAFIVPVLIIVGMVGYVTAEPRAAAGAVNQEMAKAKRLLPVGTVEVRDANRPLREGKEVFANQCAACHTTGAAGAPKLGDQAAWAPRLTQGYEALLHSALKGKGAMAAQGGGEYNDLEIGRAVVYMANEVGANFPVPQKPAE